MEVWPLPCRDDLIGSGGRECRCEPVWRRRRVCDAGCWIEVLCKSQLRGREFVSVKRPHQSGTLWWGSWGGGRAETPRPPQCLTTHAQAPGPTQIQLQFTMVSPQFGKFQTPKPRCGFQKRPALARKALDGGEQSVGDRPLWCWATLSEEPGRLYPYPSVWVTELNTGHSSWRALSTRWPANASMALSDGEPELSTQQIGPLEAAILGYNIQAFGGRIFAIKPFHLHQTNARCRGKEKQA